MSKKAGAETGGNAREKAPAMPSRRQPKGDRLARPVCLAEKTRNSPWETAGAAGAA